MKNYSKKSISRIKAISGTLDMFEEQNLDIRAVTMGINLIDCIGDYNFADFCANIRNKIIKRCKWLCQACNEVSVKYHVPIANRRISVTPIGSIIGNYINGNNAKDRLIEVAKSMEEAIDDIDAKVIELTIRKIDASDTRKKTNLIDILELGPLKNDYKENNEAILEKSKSIFRGIYTSVACAFKDTNSGEIKEDKKKSLINNIKVILDGKKIKLTDITDENVMDKLIFKLYKALHEIRRELAEKEESIEINRIFIEEAGLKYELVKVKEVCVDIIGGFSALVHKGLTSNEEWLIKNLPEVMIETEKVCASINVGSTKSGINMKAINLIGEIIKKVAEKTENSFGCAKIVVFANMPEDNPFMAGAIHGFGEGDSVINVGVSGPGVVKTSLERFKKRMGNDIDLTDLSEVIKKTSFKVTKVGELIGYEVVKRINELAKLEVTEFGIVDVSLAPTHKERDSIGEILKELGIKRVGAPGTTAALAMLTDAVKKGGLFASSHVGGLSGAFIPISEDKTLDEEVRKGHLSIEKLEAMTAVCSVGLDMIAIPGDVDESIISGIIADEIAIGVMNNKTTAVRIIPAFGKKAGEVVEFEGLFGQASVMKLNMNHLTQLKGKERENEKDLEGQEKYFPSTFFVKRSGRIPAPICSLTN